MFSGGEDGSARIWDLKMRNLSCQRIYQVIRHDVYWKTSFTCGPAFLLPDPDRNSQLGSKSNDWFVQNLLNR